MVKQTEQVTEQVNHPKHYNSHPSGVECIEIIRSMDFNIGSAFKYLYRSEYKENFLQDLNKALWYLRDEYHRRANKLFLSKNIPNLFKFSEYRYRSKLLKRIIIAEYEIFPIEFHHYLPTIYKALNEADYYPMDTYFIGTAYDYISQIINFINSSSKIENGKD